MYGTLVSYDFQAHSREMAALAGADIEAWRRAQTAVLPDFDCGRLSMDGAITRILTECGVAPGPALVARLAHSDLALLKSSCGPYPDAVPFLRELHDRGLKIALVSNCGDDTRPLLTRLNLARFADELILSCEIGAAKPDPEIYLRALDALGVSAAEAAMIDDQPAYCAGAHALGVRAVQVIRNGDQPDPRFISVATLADVPALL